MNSFDKVLDDVHNAEEQTPSLIEKVGFVTLGLVAGYLLPAVLFRLAIQCVRLADANLASWSTSILLVSNLICIPVVWAFRRHRFLAIGILVAVGLRLILLASVFSLWWWTVRTGGR